MSVAFPCRPIGALVWFPCGGSGPHQLQCKSESAQCSEKQKSPCEGERGGLKFEKNAEKKQQSNPHQRKNWA